MRRTRWALRSRSPPPRPRPALLLLPQHPMAWGSSTVRRFRWPIQGILRHALPSFMFCQFSHPLRGTRAQGSQCLEGIGCLGRSSMADWDCEDEVSTSKPNSSSSRSSGTVSRTSVVPGKTRQKPSKQSRKVRRRRLASESRSPPPQPRPALLLLNSQNPIPRGNNTVRRFR